MLDEGKSNIEGVKGRIIRELGEIWGKYGDILRDNGKISENLRRI